MPSENDDSSQNESPKYVTLEEVGNIINAALTARVPKIVGSSIETALKPVMDKLNATPPAPPQGEDDGEKKKGKQSPELLAMAKQLEDVKKQLEERDARVAAAEKKARDERAFTELRSSLEGKVRPELLDLVAKNLFHVEQRVDFDESGNPLFKTTKAPYVGAEPEEQRLPLRSGIDDFLKSDAAKPFLPAPNAGSGASPLPKRGPTQPPTGPDFSKPASSDLEKARRAGERERIARERLGPQ